jgi:hypothetical protein
MGRAVGRFGGQPLESTLVPLQGAWAYVGYEFALFDEMGKGHGKPPSRRSISVHSQINILFISNLRNLVRAPASHAGGPGFESLTAHHGQKAFLACAWLGGLFA